MHAQARVLRLGAHAVHYARHKTTPTANLLWTILHPCPANKGIDQKKQTYKMVRSKGSCCLLSVAVNGVSGHWRRGLATMSARVCLPTHPPAAVHPKIFCVRMCPMCP